MSKRVDTSGLDSQYIIGQTKRSNREQKLDPAPEPQVAPEETIQPLPEIKPDPIPIAAATEPAREPEAPKEESRRRKNREQDYKTLFVHEVRITARSGKTVYISKEHHDRIIKILQVISKNEVSLFSYIYNVLEHHFSIFQEDMNALYESNLERKVF